MKIQNKIENNVITVPPEDIETIQFVDWETFLNAIPVEWDDEDEVNLRIAHDCFWTLDTERNACYRCFDDILLALENEEPELFKRLENVQWPTDILIQM